jgi:diguanylate cyclase (GGDEF)-like protein/PAS domain S-box-containing protein
VPTRARLYILAVMGTAAGLLVTSTEMPRLSEATILVSLAAGSVLLSTLKLQLPAVKTRATLSISFVLDFAALLLLGPNKAMLVAAVGALSQSTVRVRHHNPLHRVLFNVSTLIVAVQAAGAVYRWTGGTLAPLQNWPHDLVPVIIAVVAYFVVNTGAIALAIGLSTFQPAWRVWQQNFLWAGPSYFIGAAVSVLIADIIAKQLWGLLPVAAVPAYLTYRAYSAYAGRLEDEHRHREIIESLNEGMAVIRADGHIVLWNDALERIMSVSRDRALGRTLADAVPALASTVLPQVIARVFETGQPETIESLDIYREGRRRTLQVRVFVFINGVTVFWNDITERAEAEVALKRSEERYALAAAGSNDAMWDWDLDRGEIYFSPRWKDMLGLQTHAVCNSPESWFARIHREDVEAFRGALDAHLAGHTAHFQHEYRIAHEDGSYRRVLARGVAVRGADGHATRIAGSQTDVTEQAAAQEQLRHAALHDTLTGLPNRALFMELLAQVVDRSRRHREHLFAVLFLDIDRFKMINDSLGHLVGDELLVGIARRLEHCMRAGDAIARLGGDEFTILLNDLSSVNQAGSIADRIHSALRVPFCVQDRDIFVTVSIGIAESLTGYDRADDIMRDADTAMYRAKALGRARHELFDSSMHAHALDRLSLEADIRRAMERGEFALHYQPIVNLDTRQWTGFEALLRWQRGGRSVSPSELIPIIEEMGLIDWLGTWVIQEACRQMAIWRRQFPTGPALCVTVNVSARQLNRADFVDTVCHAVENAGLQPGDLRLEITETTLMDNPRSAELVLTRLRELGVQVYLDDFGTGFSSLSYLHRFPVDALKIDQSFIASLSGSSQQTAFVESIVAMARTLGAKVIAEGVEAEAQLNELVRLGCAEAQGFLFAAALPPLTAGALMALGQTGIPTGMALAPAAVTASTLVH